MADIARLDKKRGLAGADSYPLNVFTGGDGSFTSSDFPASFYFLMLDKDKNRVYNPAALESSWSLDEGFWPVSVVEASLGDINVILETFAVLDEKNGILLAFCRLEAVNSSDEKKNISLILGLTQSRLTENKLKQTRLSKDNIILVNNTPALYLDDTFLSLNEKNIPGALAGYLKKGPLFGCDFKLEPKTQKNFSFIHPVLKKGQNINIKSLKDQDVDEKIKELRAYWRERFKVELSLPDKRYTDSFYSSIINILICKDGDELHPGPLNYKSFFLHDAVGMASALDKVGLHEPVKEALSHFNYREGGGYVDELGGSMFSLYEHYLITQDKAYLKKTYPRIIESARLLRRLRQKQFSSKLKDTPYYGLMPKGVSQDNFKYPAYLYVDNWWALLGLKAAYQAAVVFNDRNNIGWLEAEYEDLHKCTLRSIKLVMEREGIDYMRGFADKWPEEREAKINPDTRILGDAQMAWAHRPALFPGDALGLEVPRDIFEKSYKKYWQRSNSFTVYDGAWFVEYEKVFWGYNAKLAHPLIYLGMEDVALENIRWMIENQTCPGGWAEAMLARDNAEGKFELKEGIIGDMPHSWSAAHYILLLRDMLVREHDDKLVFLSAVPGNWLDDGEVIKFKDFPTYFGKVSFNLKSELDNNKLHLDIKAENPPDGGYIFNLPLAGKNIKEAEANNEKILPLTSKKILLPAAAEKVTIICK